jgi:hypothetical protein
MTKEPNDLSYRDQLNKIIASFGYNWWYDRDYVALDPNAKNNKLFRTITNLERHLPFFKKLDRSTTIKIRKIYRSFLTPAKTSSIMEVFADLLLIILFSFIVWEFVFKIFNWLGIIFALGATLTMVYLLIYSIHVIRLSDEKYLNIKFGFERQGAILKTRTLNIISKKQRELARNVFFAFVFILLAILRFIYNSPALVFVTSYFNFVAFILVIPVFIIQYWGNKFITKDSKAARHYLIASCFFVIFFIVYIISIADNYQEIKQIIGYIVDIMAFCGVILFIRALIGTNKYRNWVNETFRVVINDSKR